MRRERRLSPLPFLLSHPVRIPSTTHGSQCFNGNGEAAILFTSLLLFPPPPPPMSQTPFPPPNPLSLSIRKHPFMDQPPFPSTTVPILTLSLCHAARPLILLERTRYGQGAHAKCNTVQELEQGFELMMIFFQNK